MLYSSLSHYLQHRYPKWALVHVLTTTLPVIFLRMCLGVQPKKVLGPLHLHGRVLPIAAIWEINQWIGNFPLSISPSFCAPACHTFGCATLLVSHACPK